MDPAFSDPSVWQIAGFLGSILIYALAGAVVCAVAGYLMLDRVDRGGVGIALGLFLGPIGLVIAWVIRDNALRDEERDRAIRRRELDRVDEALLVRRPSATPARGAPPTADLEALERLARLHRAGDLSDQEFVVAKRRILGGVTAPRLAEPPPRRFR